MFDTVHYSAATIDITPRNPVTLAGYAGRFQKYESIALPLEGNAVFLRCGDVATLFIALDLLFAGRDVCDTIAERASNFGLAREHIVVSASHTHFAPATDPSKPALGRIDPEYWSFLQQQLRRVVDLALGSPLKVATLTRSQTDTALNVNRRRRWRWPTLTRTGVRLRPQIVMAPALDKPRDTTLDAITIHDEHGNVAAVLWKFACHPVAYPHALKVSSEFPGYARNFLRHRVGSNIPVVFWQGFSGDVRPHIPNERTRENRFAVLRSGPSFHPSTEATWSAWAEQVAEALAKGVTGADGAPLPGPTSIASTRIAATSLIGAARNSREFERSLEIQHIDFGASLRALFVSAEVCTPYWETLREGRSTICVGCTNDVLGYLPSQQQVAEGGYEAEGFFKSFGLTGPWRRGFAQLVMDAITRLGDANAPPL